ncbi:hypothetical protein [Catenulispora pinisilvae]|uniref:hypothetical protein n=1 Tax=Catenulispora pinisilvae TaxID=2705253 RepID=UPI0018911D7B|nr:hypothetical protein [Catenulispora pinisilvae]
MTTVPALTADSYERLVAGLRGRVIIAVGYFVLMVGEEGTDPEEWDYSTWHEPTMGVELAMDDGSTYTATWGHTFDYYGLELYAAPMSDFLSNLGQPGGAARIEATGHPLWAQVLATPIDSSRIQWLGEEDGAPTPTPKALHLKTATGQVWIAAGRSAVYPPDGRIYLGTDDVLVTYDSETAAQAGLEV